MIFKIAEYFCTRWRYKNIFFLSSRYRYIESSVCRGEKNMKSVRATLAWREAIMSRCRAMGKKGNGRSTSVSLYGQAAHISLSNNP